MCPICVRMKGFSINQVSSIYVYLFLFFYSSLLCTAVHISFLGLHTTCLIKCILQITCLSLLNYYLMLFCRWISIFSNIVHCYSQDDRDAMVLLNEGPTHNLPDLYKFRNFMFFILLACDNINQFFFWMLTFKECSKMKNLHNLQENKQQQYSKSHLNCLSKWNHIKVITTTYKRFDVQ